MGAGSAAELGLARLDPALAGRFAGYYQRLRALPRRVRRAFGRRLRVSLAGTALLLALGQGEALAATITVDGTICTLADAITAANMDTATGGCPAGSGADTLDLQADVTLTAAADNTYNPTGLPTVTTEITIEGNGHTVQRDAGAPAFRLMAVGATGNLTINQTTLNGGVTGLGGGVWNSGMLTLTNSTLSGNSARLWGGGVENRGTVTLTNSTLSGNSAGFDGGGVWNSGTLTLTNSLIAGNAATDTSAEIHNIGIGSIIADSYNLFGHNGLTNAQAFTGFTPGATDITATSNGTAQTALAAILNTTLADNGGPTWTMPWSPAAPPWVRFPASTARRLTPTSGGYRDPSLRAANATLAPLSCNGRIGVVRGSQPLRRQDS